MYGKGLSMDTEEIVRRWSEDFARHPMFGEGMTGEQIDEMWESGSSKYSDSSYAEIRDRIIETMLSEGCLGPNVTVLDIGSGPGTFAIPLSRHCKRVICVDKSRGMLDRITSSDIANISVLQSDCLCIPQKYASDVAFSSLCPPMNTPEGIDCMCRLGKRCVYVSSSSHEEGLEGRIWRKLGKDYSYTGYDTDYPYRYLRSKGVDASIRYFTQEKQHDESVSDCIRRFATVFSRYRYVGDTVMDAISEVVKDSSEDGIVHHRNTQRFGMLTWNSPDSSE